MKTTLLTLAVSITFSISFNREANANNNSKLSTPTRGASSIIEIEPIIENNLIIEDWMIDDQHWITTNTKLNNNELMEEEIEIEDWMSDDNFFKFNSMHFTFNEEPLQIEKWMSDNSYWKEVNNTKVNR
jgi:hypothetical protein